MVHGCMVHTECTKTAAVSHGTSHVTTTQRCKHTTSVDIQNALKKRGARVTHLESRDKSAASLPVNGEQHYIKVIINQSTRNGTQLHSLQIDWIIDQPQD